MIQLFNCQLSQEVCADALAELLFLCAGRSPSPNDKLLRNIASMATADLQGQQQGQGLQGASSLGQQQSVQGAFAHVVGVRMPQVVHVLSW